jgi:excisionase family DNA binding protein
MERTLTTKDLAEVIGASESSLRRWTNSGIIGMARTVGGHRRIPLSEAIRYIRESHAPVLRPDLLGLGLERIEPVQQSTRDAIEQKVIRGLTQGAAHLTKGAILSLYLDGTSVASIFDGPIQQAMRAIGELWHHGTAGISTEHRATDICLQAISTLRDLLPAPPLDAPIAIGGAPSGDRYLLPSLMVATILADTGYRVSNLGPEIPVDILANAAEHENASVVWLSVSVIGQKNQLRQDIQALTDRLRLRNARLLIGGRSARDLTLRSGPHLEILQNMAELAAFIRGARPPVPVASHVS